MGQRADALIWIFFDPDGQRQYMAPQEQRSLGHPVSPWLRAAVAGQRRCAMGVVKRQKMANTTVVVTGDIPGAKPSAGRDCRSEAL